MSSNHVTGTLSAEDVAVIMAAIGTIKSKLPFLVGLTLEERHTLPKMGPKSVGFVNAALTVAQQNPTIVPGAFDMAEFGRDAALLGSFGEVAMAIAQLNELAQDTLLALGSDSYTAGLVVYQCAQMAGKGQGLDTQLDALGQRFARRSKAATATAAAAK
jgi:hypothetical protein